MLVLQLITHPSLSFWQESSDAKVASAAKESDSNSSNSNSNSTGGSPNSSNSSSTDVVAPTTVGTVDVPLSQSVATTVTTDQAAMYEQSVLDKENSLIHSFSNMIIDENAKNLQQQFEVSNGKLLHVVEADAVPVTVPVTSPVALANGNGHIENVNNKK